MKLTERGRQVLSAATAAGVLIAGGAGFYSLMLLVTAVAGPDFP